MLIVSNIKDRKTRPDFHTVYVARPSILGNPFILLTENERTNVINAYKHWLLNNIKLKNDNIPVNLQYYVKHFGVTIVKDYITPKSKHVCAELNNIVKLLNSGKNVELLCYCSPKPCHADIIKEIIETRKNE